MINTRQEENMLYQEKVSHLTNSREIQIAINTQIDLKQVDNNDHSNYKGNMTMTIHTNCTILSHGFTNSRDYFIRRNINSFTVQYFLIWLRKDIHLDDHDK